jgi:hypothetical protein
MNTYLVTSREGLFLYDNLSETFKKLRDGLFFGLAKYNETWYVFGYNGEKNYPTFQGYIASFTITDDSTEIQDWVVRYTGLDNGSHQIKIYNHKLYIVETYIQTIKVFSIKQNGTLNLARSVPMYKNEQQRIINAHYIINGDQNDTHTTCRGYKHINALTIHDNLIYLSCPSLRNNITPDGKATQMLSPHIIEVYTIDFEYLWSFTILREVFCHDIVFQGHKIYFNAPPNKICVFDIVSKQTHTAVTLDIDAFHPRGLSIDKDGLILVGLRKPGMIVSFMQNNKTHIKYTQAPCNPCFIAKLDYDKDFNNNNSSLVKAYVKQLHSSKLPISSTVFDNISQHVFQHDWTKYNDIRYMQKTPCLIKSSKIYELNGVKEPSIEVFDNIMNLQQTSRSKIHIAQLIVHDEMRVKHQSLLELLYQLEQEVQKRALRISGHLYMYAPQSALGWHTNLEELYNHHTIRCYIVNTTKDNETYFLYKHPFSNLIHALPDRNNFANIFALGDATSPLWHAVYNDSKDTNRLSLGIAFHQHRLGAFHTLRDDIQEILH